MDDGELCVWGDAVPSVANLDGVFSKLEAGHALNVEVALDECLSSSCDHARTASCRVVLHGDQLVVESRLEWTSHGGECTTDCGHLVARCASPPLAAGRYSVRFGKTVPFAITVPGELGELCAK
ncbi:MAG TPA: hypothetical protein VJR89_17580 [Polyangiales bacterium]|nr:hypothetical protein [Polyangiales bacterium]